VGVVVTGRMAVAGTSGEVSGGALGGRQGRVVLASLATSERAVHREVLAERLWPHGPPGGWRRDLSSLVSRLRGALRTAGADGVAIESDGTLYAVTGTDVDVRRARRGARALASGPPDPAAAVALADEVLRVTTRPFMVEEQGIWAAAVREELAAMRAVALEGRAAAARTLGDPASARRSLEELVTLSPFNERAHRALMELHLTAGRRDEALRVFEELRAVLAEELGIEPEARTQDLHRLASGPEPVVRPPGTAGRRAPPARPALGVPVHYARSGEVSIAYQVLGDGPTDLVWVPGWVSNLEVAWEEPRYAAFLRALARHRRVLLFDKRGTGLSDPVPVEHPPDSRTRMDDVRAVMDACGSERAALFGFSEGGTLAVEFAVAHPDRTTALVLWGTWAAPRRTEDAPGGWTGEETHRRFVEPLRNGGTVSPRWFAPSAAGDPDFDAWFDRYARMSASPGMAVALLRANAGTDVRSALPHVTAPTLVLHRTDDPLVPVEQGRYVARGVPGARLVEHPGLDHWPWIGDGAAVLAAMESFLAECSA
jgi:pimeloyl-ACP methyl ester carboxylesterase/DNA-binding SARP family transcriptional activator